MKTQYMVATKAIHKLGDISRSFPDLCIVDREDDFNYYGSFVMGHGFIEVRFPKATTRKLTDKEVKQYASRYGIGNEIRFEITEEELMENQQ